MPIDPIVLEIVEGTLASAEAEVEAAIERTARSPMIREARDFRGGIHDRHCRKLTGRSYSALVQPIVRDFPLESMRPGDVFFHNDVYQSEGGIGHLPDLCVTVPVQVEACFEAILARTTETFQRELISKIPEGTYVWEDYAEHDGVDPPRLHAQRMSLTRTPDSRLIIDLNGTSPQ